MVAWALPVRAVCRLCLRVCPQLLLCVIPAPEPELVALGPFGS